MENHIDKREKEISCRKREIGKRKRKEERGGGGGEWK